MFKVISMLLSYFLKNTNKEYSSVRFNVYEVMKGGTYTLLTLLTLVVYYKVFSLTGKVVELNHQINKLTIVINDNVIATRKLKHTNAQLRANCIVPRTVRKNTSVRNVMN